MSNSRLPLVAPSDHLINDIGNVKFAIYFEVFYLLASCKIEQLIAYFANEPSEWNCSFLDIGGSRGGA